MNNLGWGLQMTVLGMGLVFTLLILLWGLLSLILRLDTPEAEAEPEAEPVAEPVAAAPVAAPSFAAIHGMDPDLVAAMMMAVLIHKEVRRGEAAPAMRSYWPGSLLYASRWVATGRSRQNRTWKGRG